MDAQTQPGLTSDIQLALQHAVGQANNAFANGHAQDGRTSKKSKKRARQDESEGQDGGGEQVVERKKKKRKPAVVEEPLADIQPEGVGSVVTESKKKKLKSKVNKKSSPQSPTTDVESPGSSVDIQTAFLNAVLSAASATSNAPAQPSPDISYPQPVLPVCDAQPLQFAPYPLPSALYPYPSSIPSTSSEIPQLFGANVPFDFDFGSNDDLIRIMQDLDVSKITNVLKTLSEAAAAANVPLGFLDSLVSQPPREASSVPVDQTPSSSNRILGIPPKQLAKPVHRSRITNINLSPVDATDNPEHAHMLAAKWLSANRLAEMVKTEGLVYKKGKFSAIEEAQLNKAIENYRARSGISEDALLDIIFPRNTKDRDNAFWSEITSAVSLRPIIAVYHHVRRKNHPLKQQGRWMPIEDSMLKHAVAELGQQWEKISDRVGRMASDCRDRYRNHIEHREHRSHGAWTKEEEALLTQIVTEITVSQGRDPDNDVFWGVVSQRMNNKRGRQQCRIKWLDSLSKTVKNQGDKPRWSLVDAYILVHKVHSLNVRDDSEIDWKTLPDANWNFWSAHTLQRRWQTMKRGIRGHEDMSHEEIMDILLVKNVHLPVDTGRRQRKIVSAEAVEDSEEDVDDLNQTQSGPALLVDGFIGTAPSPTIQPGGNHSSSSSDEE